MNSVRELMAIYGYKYTGMCNCSGTKTYKYKNGDYEFRWRVNKYQFHVKEKGITIKGWSLVKEAESYLKTLHQNITA